MNSVFNKIDNFNFTFLGFNPLGALKNVKIWRRYILILLILSTFSWLIFGWESTWSQPFTYVKSLPLLLTGQTTLTQVQVEALSFYGIGQHLSSFVIYGFSFLLISIHLEKLNIKKSLNFMSSLALTAMSVGVYELIYNVLYSNLQNQSWTFSLQWRQGLNIFMFSFFAVLGIITLVYLYSFGYRPNFSLLTRFLLLMSYITYGIWVFYPLPTQTLTMETTTGTWSSTQFFPQTMYAVDINPLDEQATGEPVFVENNTIHLVNILNKVFVSLTILNFIMIRRNKIEN